MLAMVGDAFVKWLRSLLANLIPKNFVDKFFKLIANTKSQRDVVLKGIENLRNEEAED